MLRTTQKAKQAWKARPTAAPGRPDAADHATWLRQARDTISNRLNLASGLLSLQAIVAFREQKHERF
jgi:hypothetical protein